MGCADGPDGRVSSGSDVYHKIDMDRGVTQGPHLHRENHNMKASTQDILLQRIDVVFTDAIPKRTFVYSLFPAPGDADVIGGMKMDIIATG